MVWSYDSVVDLTHRVVGIAFFTSTRNRFLMEVELIVSLFSISRLYSLLRKKNAALW